MMDYLSANWPWIALVGLMIVMHTRHGGCRRHHGHDHSRQSKRDDGETSDIGVHGAH